MPEVSDELLALLAEISDLDCARELLAWDEHTKMPPRGAAARAEQLATLTRLSHRRLASDELGRLLDGAQGALEGGARDPFAAGLVRVTRREWERARRVPAELRAEIARTTSLAEHAWETARAESDFGAFLPSLERVIDLKRHYLECFEYDHPYDPLLDDFEPEMKTAELAPLLARVRDGARELLSEIAAAPNELDASPLFGSFSPDVQEALAQDVAARLPLEPGSWRLDPTVHPFATGIAISDLRITTRFDPGYVGTALWSVIHEVGHAMYHNGIDPQLARTPLCSSASMGFDESQSRLWENWVGRGRPFLGHLLPLLAERFPRPFAAIGAEDLYRAANRVSPSPIRVEADEVTYNLHIALRFELELALFEERIPPRELPEAWRAKTREYLGIEPADDAAGVLQDVHWAAGLFGYFPTYSLGNVIAAQVWEGVRAALPELDAQLARGELDPLRDHLRERIYRHGAMLSPADLAEQVAGRPLDPDPLIAGLRRKFGELYELG